MGRMESETGSWNYILMSNYVPCNFIHLGDRQKEKND